MAITTNKRLTKHATDVVDYTATLSIRSSSVSTAERKLLGGPVLPRIDDQYDRHRLETQLMEKPLGLWAKCKGDPDLLVEALEGLKLDATTRKKIDEFLVRKLGSRP